MRIFRPPAFLQAPRRRLGSGLLALLLSACVHAGPWPDSGESAIPQMHDDHVMTDDAYELSLRHWPAAGDETRGIVLAIHGFNDHGGSFDALAGSLTEHGFAVYAYDQRGFGASTPRGIWAGEDLLVRDAVTAAWLLKRQNPGLPLHLVGKSMGGAVSILAMTSAAPPPVDSLVLIAPAVWGAETMPWYQRVALEVGDTLMPGLPLPSELAQAVGIRPTDDDAVLKAMSEDPKRQSTARIDTIEGLAELMGSALKASSGLPGPTLILYGDTDGIIPREAICAMLDRLPPQDEGQWRMLLYPGGYHMLTRYTGASQVHTDIAAWLAEPGTATLPSRHEVDRDEARRRLCK